MQAEARVAKSADATDLKSVLPQGGCGFNSRPGHQRRQAACRQKRRVRFATATALVNELVEAKQNGQVRRVMARWRRYEVVVLDEVGYVPPADVGAEFLFQVIADRTERAALIAMVIRNTGTDQISDVRRSNYAE